MSEVDPIFEVALHRIGALKNLAGDREWFLESVWRSRAAIDFAMAERDRELAALAEGVEYDGLA